MHTMALLAYTYTIPIYITLWHNYEMISLTLWRDDMVWSIATIYGMVDLLPLYMHICTAIAIWYDICNYSHYIIPINAICNYIRRYGQWYCSYRVTV